MKSKLATAAIKKFISKNPDLSYREFCTRTKSKISSCYYYATRSKVTGVTREQKKKKSGTFVKIFSAPTAGLSDQAKTVFKDFVGVISEKYTALQLLEYPLTGEIEVREIR